MFRLIRYFAVASLIGFVIVTALLGYLYRQTAVQNLTDMAEEKNVATTLSFANSLWPEVVPFIGETIDHDYETLYAHPRIPELHALVVEQVAGLSVVKIKIYNPNGITIFSTEIEQIGTSEEDNAGFLAAWTGNVISELTHRDTFNAFDGVIEDQDVLATYVPIRAGGRSGAIVGVIELYSNVTPLLRRVNSVQRNIILGVAGILAVLYGALVLLVYRGEQIIRKQQRERDRAESELRQQQRTLATSKEQERLVRELHDRLGQVLGYVKMQSQAALELFKENQSEQGYSHIQRLIDSVQDVHTDVREYIMNLQSGISGDQDFVSALESYLEKFSRFSDIRTQLATPAPGYDPDLLPQVEAQILRIVQEALTNVRKHANARQVTVRLSENEHEICVAISDDGHGFHMDDVPTLEGHHVGLQSMQDRAIDVDGHVHIRSAPGRGTEISVTIPTRQKADQNGLNGNSSVYDANLPNLSGYSMAEPAVN